MDDWPKVPKAEPCPFCGTDTLNGSLMFASFGVPYRRGIEVPTLALCADGFGNYWVQCHGSRGVVECCRGPRVSGPATERDMEKVGRAATRAVEAWNRRERQGRLP